MSHMYDCMIVGAGPGGSSLAAALAKAGLDVLLLDKSKFPRYKVCGGGITKRASLKMPIDISPVIRDKVNTFIIAEGKKEKHVVKHKTPFIYMVMRDELDQLLANYAIDCGVTFKSGAAVKMVEEHMNYVVVKTRTDMFAGKFLVGADGVHSTIAKQVGLMTDRRKAAALEHEIVCNDEMMSYFKNKVVVDYQSVPNGYLWVFPKGRHLSVGIGSYTLNHEEMSPILRSFIDLYQLDGEVISEKGSFLSAGGKRHRLITERTALIGDAAGMVDSFMGEGIYYALWSAELLSCRLVDIFNHQSHTLAPYQKDIDKLILPELQAFDYLGRKFYKSPRAAEFLLTYSPKLLTMAIEVLEGNRGFDGFYKKIFTQL